MFKALEIGTTLFLHAKTFSHLKMSMWRPPLFGNLGYATANHRILNAKELSTLAHSGDMSEKLN